VPRIKSAVKRVEVTERNRERNRAWRSSIRTARNKVENALDSKDANLSVEALKGAYSTIDRAVAKGVLHKNTAARRKARLVKLMRKVKGA
jgi:small subunit ribosomal protein S20